MLNVDPQVVVHALAGELTRAEETLLREDSWSVSAIVRWETGKLTELGRIELDLADAELSRTLGRLHVWPVTLDVCRGLRRLDIRSDPADEILAATSLVHQVPLVTRDARLRQSRLVPPALPRRA
jgi:PIN domain nuclease of toxin-antitoxin system